MIVCFKVRTHLVLVIEVEKKCGAYESAHKSNALFDISVLCVLVVGTMASDKTLDNPCGGAAVRGPIGLRTGPLNKLANLPDIIDLSRKEAREMFSSVVSTFKSSCCLKPGYRTRSELIYGTS